MKLLTVNAKSMKKAELEIAVNEWQAEQRAKGDNCKRWAYAGVALMAVMSAWLNGYANAQHATIWIAGWAMGIAIPVLVLILARVAGLQYRRGNLTMAKAGAGVGVALLVLSIWHCATSIALITGSGIWLALPMAIAIDAGLVYCECATLSD